MTRHAAPSPARIRRVPALTAVSGGLAVLTTIRRSGEPAASVATTTRTAELVL